MAATGVPFERGEGSMSKLAASETAVETTERAIQTMGGWGYITDHPVEKWYRDAKLYTIFEGTSEIQRVVISTRARRRRRTRRRCTSTSNRPAARSTRCSAAAPRRGRVADAALSARSGFPVRHADGDEGAPAAQEVRPDAHR